MCSYLPTASPVPLLVVFDRPRSWDRKLFAVICISKNKKLKQLVLYQMTTGWLRCPRGEWVKIIALKLFKNEIRINSYQPTWIILSIKFRSLANCGSDMARRAALPGTPARKYKVTAEVKSPSFCRSSAAFSSCPVSVSQAWCSLRSWSKPGHALTSAI